MRVYLCARYGRREELCGYRAQLAAAGHIVTSTWLDGEYAAYEQEGEALPAWVARLSVANDKRDMQAAEAAICFTETPRSGASSRGGRHYEAGYLDACGKPLFIVGPQENVFYQGNLRAQHFADWQTFVDMSGFFLSRQEVRG